MAQALKLVTADPLTPFDAAAISAELAKLAASYTGNERELRTAVALRLKAALDRGPRREPSLLLKDRHGGRCAARLCRLQDEIIRVLYRIRARSIFIRRKIPPKPSAWRWSRPAATAAG